MANENNYEQLLEDAYKNVKPVESKIDRFDLPKVEGHIEGIKTIVTNFKQICSNIRRNPEHVLKYLLKELASPGTIKEDRLILTRKISGKAIGEKIKKYIDMFVICKECGKPDTELTKEDRLSFIHCLACGAKKSVTRI